MVSAAPPPLPNLPNSLTQPSCRIPALSICTFLGLCSAHSFTLIGRACELTGEKDFKGLWARTLGERSSSFVDVMVALMCSAAGVIYSGVLGDVSTELLAGVWTTFSYNIVSMVLLWPSHECSPCLQR